MKKLAAAALALAVALPAHAKKVAGVDFPDTVDVGGRALKLNGAGLRKKFVIKVYAGGLYLAEPSRDANAIVEADAPKRVRMVFLRDVSRKQIMDAYRDGFRANSAGPKLDALLGQLKEIEPAIPNMREGGEMSVTYVPGEGTTVAAAGDGKPVTVPGKDFADAMFRNWLGREPADGDLKKALLGR
ncbi:MAG TPA: chalcone isomerase family protein [Anaeromyxobacter sp.]|nr:chalcone isomerase family protein [Anaeromyxobacter sp.]